MKLGIFASLMLLVLAFGLTLGTCLLVWPFAQKSDRPAFRRWLVRWSLQGAALPLLLWAIFNIGLSVTLPPLMPSVQHGWYMGNRWPAFVSVLGPGAFVIVSYWAALTLAWVLIRAQADLKDDARSDFRSLTITCSLAMSIVAAVILFLGGWPVAGLALAVILAPIALYAPQIVIPPKLPPIYARAVAKMKFGKYTEAEWEIISQLEACEDDFQGWLMMAELYAVHFRNLPEAEQTITDLCRQPGLNASQVSVALHKLAEWHLSVGNNPEAAARVLQQVENRFKGTHLAHMANLRRRQLPLSSDEWLEQKASQPVPLPALGDSLEQSPAAPPTPAELARAREIATKLQNRLAQDPDNVPARERLARILVEQLSRSAEGISHLDILLRRTDEEPSKKAEWLGLLAAWEFKYRNDPLRGVECLQRLVDEYPGTAPAFAAKTRLEKLRRQQSKNAKGGTSVPPS